MRRSQFSTRNTASRRLRSIMCSMGSRCAPSQVQPNWWHSLCDLTCIRCRHRICRQSDAACARSAGRRCPSSPTSWAAEWSHSISSSSLTSTDSGSALTEQLESHSLPVRRHAAYPDPTCTQRLSIRAERAAVPCSSAEGFKGGSPDASIHSSRFRHTSSVEGSRRHLQDACPCMSPPPPIAYC